jgi:hyperosmotically inducible protein
MGRGKAQDKRIVLTTALLVAIGIPGVLAATGASGETGKTTPSSASHSNEPRTEADQYLNDTWITTKVKATLLADEGTTGLAIGVATQDGVVQLSGFVDKPEQISRAVQIARGVEGVKRVENDVQLKK